MNSRDVFRGPPKGRQSGVTLVEILVTTVIISIGLLGVAALHLTSLRNSQDSNTRTKAIWLATDIIERMRANRDAARNGDYVVGFGDTLTPGTIAGDDVVAWKATLEDDVRGLPEGLGSIGTNAVGTAVIFTITVQWTERDGARSFVTQTEI